MADGGHEGAGERIKVVVVDDHSIFRSGLKADLDESIDVVGEAHDVESAVRIVTDAAPDVVLLDVHLPGVGVPDGSSGGAEVIRRVAASARPTDEPAATVPRFLALSVSDKADDVVGVIRAGARGYITKGSSGADVSRAVHAVAGGDAVFSPKLAGFVLDAFGAAVGETAAAGDELDRLSAREQEVMRLIARGYAYKEVAAELFISTKTVETHVSAVLRKLQLSSRHELTVWASARRLL